MTKTYFNIMALAGLLSLMACADEIAPEALTATDDNVITLSLSSEAQTTPTTRAFGTGAHAKQLIYMIYKDMGDGQYEKDTYFLGDNDTYQIDNNTTLQNCGVINDFDPTKQTSIRLIPNPADSVNQKYKIVCWAQEKDSPYFDLTGFPQKITINYNNKENGTLTSTNNTENLDAFYCSTTFTVSDKGTNVPIVLKRPFAQINIGTSGWDYEGFAFIEPQPKIIKYSKMTVTGVATSFNPFDNKCEVPAGDLTTVTFDWTKLPAYRNLDLQDTTIEKSITGIYTTDHRVSEKTDSFGIFIKEGVEEEFLLLKLPRPESTENKDKDYPDGNYNSYEPYIGWKKYDGFCATSSSHEELLKNIFTETFKYLSMCYVLVPFEVKVDANGNETGRTSSTVKLEFDCAVNKPATGQSWEGVLGANTPVLKLNNVPAVSNHRTNIVAADGTGFFMNANELKVAVYSETFGEYYKRLDATSDKWEEGNGKDGDRLNDGEGGFNWPEDDIDPEANKFPMPAPKITINQSDDQYFSPSPEENTMPEENTIKVFAYINRNDKRFDDERNNNNANVSFTVNNDSSLFDHFEFYLEDEKIDDTDVTNNTITKSVTELITIIEKNKIEKVTDVSKKEVQIPYYPITCTVKAVPTKKNYRTTYLPVTIKVYPIYEKYTFSKDSKDEGGIIWNYINEHGTPGSVDATENGCRYIVDSEEKESTTISVTSRKGTGNNSRLYAITNDHLKFRGAGGFTASDAPNGIGHYVTLNQLAGNSKITVKVGRDILQDNSDNSFANFYNRQLKFQYTNNGNANYIGYGYTWEALPKGSPFLDSNGYKYAVNQTTIANGYDVELSKPSDVKISMSDSGFCFYWIIVSETDNDM